MTGVDAHVDASYVVMDWLNSLPDLVGKLTSTVRGKSRTSIYMNVPPAAFADGQSSLLPLLAFSQVAGGVIGNDFTVQQARISFDLFAKNRFQVSDIKDCLVSHVEALGPAGGFASSKGALHDARTINIIYQLEGAQEPDNSIHRFIVDAFCYVTPVR